MDWRAPAAIILAVAVAYATAFGAAFQFDDFHAVVDNADVHSWSAWLASMPAIRALTKASYTLSWMLAPVPASFVALSVAMHALAAVLVYDLVRRWLPALAPGVCVPAAAALVAIVFALHPAQTEAVTYVAGRSVVLAGVLALASLWAADVRRERASPIAWTIASCALLALALAARETAWTVPFALVLIDVARGEPLAAAARRAAPQFVVVALAAVAMLMHPVYHRLLAQSVAFRDPFSNLVAQVDALAYIVTNPLLTLRVSFDPHVVVSGTSSAAWWIALAGLTAVAAIGFAALRREPWLGVGLLWFLLHLLPTNSVFGRYDLASDRHLYLALAGPALIAGAIVGRIGRVRVRRGLAVGLALVLGVATFARNTDYRSEIALWEATVRASPGKARAWNNLGYAWEQAGDRERARDAYRRALALDPDYPKARINLERVGANFEDAVDTEPPAARAGPAAGPGDGRLPKPPLADCRRRRGSVP